MSHSHTYLEPAPRPDFKEVFATRLHQAREAAGLTLRGLAEALGGQVSHTALNKYEKGLMAPDSRLVIALAKALACPVDQFFRPLRPSLGAIRFRKKSSLRELARKAAESRAQDHVERYIELEELLALAPAYSAPIDRPCQSFADAEDAARQVRQTWQLGHGPLPNVLELLEERGVKVIRIDADEKFDGCSAWLDQHPVIVLAAHLDRNIPKLRFTALHELGHLVLGIAEDHPDEEKLCHRFAAAMLWPQEQAYQSLGRHRQNVMWPELVSIKREYGISLAAALYRLKDLAILPESKYRWLQIQYKQQGWHKNEPGSYAGEEAGLRFDQLLMRALAEEKITLSKAAALAHESLEALRHRLALPEPATAANEDAQP
jgi:Zn-dependent peptidase ImmA (M78 family)/DNA-binding XRE family transcriptional regulator